MEVQQWYLRILHEDMQLIQLGGDVGCNFCAYFRYRFPPFLTILPLNLWALHPNYHFLGYKKQFLLWHIIFPFLLNMNEVIYFLWLTRVSVEEVLWLFFFQVLPMNSRPKYGQLCFWFTNMLWGFSFIDHFCYITICCYTSSVVVTNHCCYTSSFCYKPLLLHCEMLLHCNCQRSWVLFHETTVVKHELSVGG